MFNFVTMIFEPQNKYGELNVSRHGCGACVTKDGYLYVFGGSKYKGVKSQRENEHLIER